MAPASATPAAVAIAREDPRQPDVTALVAALDRYHDALYPPASNHHLAIATLAQGDIHFLVARKLSVAVGCGALRTCAGYGELKRMYVTPAARGQGIGGHLLAALVEVARTAGLPCVRLETGIAQPEALGLYARFGFRDRAAFGDYTPDPLSRYLELRLA